MNNFLLFLCLNSAVAQLGFHYQRWGVKVRELEREKVRERESEREREKERELERERELLGREKEKERPNTVKDEVH